MSPKARCIPQGMYRRTEKPLLCKTQSELETPGNRGRERIKIQAKQHISGFVWWERDACKNDMLKLSASALCLSSSDFNSIFDLQLTWPLKIKHIPFGSEFTLNNRGFRSYRLSNNGVRHEPGKNYFISMLPAKQRSACNSKKISHILIWRVGRGIREAIVVLWLKSQ